MLEIKRSAIGAAASAPTNEDDPLPVSFPSHTTTVYELVAAAHQASRCPLLVPVFQATCCLAASRQTAAVRSKSLSEVIVCQQADSRKMRRPSLLIEMEGVEFVGEKFTRRAIPPRASVAYASAISIGVASAPPIASDKPYRAGRRPSERNPAACMISIAGSTPISFKTQSAGIFRLSA